MTTFQKRVLNAWMSLGGLKRNPTSWEVTDEMERMYGKKSSERNVSKAMDAIEKRFGIKE